MARKKIPLLILILGFPLTLGAVVVGYWYWTTVVEKNLLLPAYGALPPFRLTAETGAAFTRDDLLGKITIADLIFTQCGGVCPMMSTRLAGIQDSLAGDRRIQYVSISVDPGNDTPAALLSYARAYNADPGRWFFLTGDTATIYMLAREGFHLAVGVDSAGGIVHSEKFILLDQTATIRGYYDSDDDDAIQLLRRDARLLARRIGR